MKSRVCVAAVSQSVRQSVESVSQSRQIHKDPIRERRRGKLGVNRNGNSKGIDYLRLGFPRFKHEPGPAGVEKSF